MRHRIQAFNRSAARERQAVRVTTCVMVAAERSLWLCLIGAHHARFV